MSANALIATFLFIKSSKKNASFNWQSFNANSNVVCRYCFTILRFVITFNEIFYRMEITNKPGKHFSRCFYQEIAVNTEYFQKQKTERIRVYNFYLFRCLHHNTIFVEACETIFTHQTFWFVFVTVYQKWNCFPICF